MIKETGQLLKIIGIGTVFTLFYEGTLWLVKKANQTGKKKKVKPSELSLIKSKVRKREDKISA